MIELRNEILSAESPHQCSHSRLRLIVRRLIPAARAPGVGRLSFFELVETSMGKPSYDLPLIVIQIGPVFKVVLTATRAFFLNIHSISPCDKDVCLLFSWSRVT
jgi:hypothetical protein